jgi:Secretion system C-terminal sorting domain/Metallo-peptidase family M12
MTAQLTFSLKEISLPKAMEEKVKTQVSEFQAYEINLPLFNRYLKSHSPTDTIPIKINIGTIHSIDCRIAEYEVRSKNCLESVVKANETEIKERERCNTYREIDSKVAYQKMLLLASSRYFSAHLYIGTESYQLVSLSSFDGTTINKNILILYKERSLIKKPFNCGNAGIIEPLFGIQQPVSRPENNAIRFVELAVVADYEYYAYEFGGNNNYGLTKDKIYFQMLEVSNLFDMEFSLRFIIVDIEIWQTPTQFGFTYPFTGNSQNRWDQIRAYFNRTASNPPVDSYVGKRSCVNRDAALLFTKTTGPVGTTSGSRFGQNKLCGTDDPTELTNSFCADKNGWAYCVNNGSDWETTAHELSHLLGTFDNDGNCGLMCYSCNKNNLCICDRPRNILEKCYSTNITGRWNDANWSRINGHIYGIEQLLLACPPHTRGSCLLNEPNNNTPFIIGSDLICGWGNYSIDVTDLGTEIVWNTQDPDIIRSSGSFPYTGPSIEIMSNVPGYHTIKASFQYNCEPYVLYKSIWFGPPQLPEVYTFDDACDNGHGTCKIFEVSFNKANTRGIDDFTLTPQGCSYCNFYTTGSFALGTISVWNVHAGECVNVSGNAYNECGSTDFSQTFCNTNSYLIAKNDLTIFPNPANDNFFVGTRSKGIISVFNILGEKVATYTKDDYPKVEVDTKAWSSGTYIVKFDSDGEIVTKKVSVSH